MIFPAYEISATAVFAAAFYFAAHRWVPLPNSRAGVRAWSIAWVIAATVLFWIAGPYSANPVTLELDFSVPMHQVYAALPSGTKFAHGFGGGMDAYALNQFSGQYASLERFLVSVPPMWLGLALHRILTVSIMLAGAYRLCRALGAGRSPAFAAALVATVAADYIYLISFWHGTSLAVLPMAAYLLVCRQGRRLYWPGVLCFGLWCAFSVTVPIGMLNLLFAVSLSALVIDWRSIPRFAAATAVVVGCVVLNLHEQIYAMASIAPHTFRGAAGGKPYLENLSTIIRPAELAFAAAAAGLAAAAVQIRRRADSGVFRAVLGVAGYPLLGALAASLPYGLVGLKFAESLGWGYLSLGFFLPVIILAARVMQNWPRLAAPCAALAAGKLTVYTGVAAALWFSVGGLSSARLDSLINPSWLPNDLVRVAGVPYRLSEGQLSALGLESAVAQTSLQPGASVPFWLAVNSQNPDTPVRFPAGPSLYGSISEKNAKCCLEYDIEKFGVDADLLRLTNIGFLISRVPLTGSGLKKAAGPPDGTVLPRSDTPRLERIGPYIRWIIDPPPPYVYALPDPFPRVYAPSGRVVLADDSNYAAVMAAVKDRALKGGLVVRESDSKILGPAPETARVGAVKQVLNGYDVTLNPSSGSSSAAVILNVVYTPFWRAYADGAQVPLVQANQIQMAAAVPPGTRSLEFRYERQLLRERLFGD